MNTSYWLFGMMMAVAGTARADADVARLGQFNFLLSDGEHLIATEPLSHHAGWAPFAPGELRIYRDGRRIQLSRIPP